MSTRNQLRETFTEAVMTMAKKPSESTRVYRRAMLKIHPDKQRNNSTKNLAVSLTSKLSGIHGVIGEMPHYMLSNLKNRKFVQALSAGSSPYDPSRMSQENIAVSTPERHHNHGSSHDPNWTPSGSNNNNNFGAYGREYVPNPTYNRNNRTRTRRAGDPTENKYHSDIKITNPVQFKRYVFSKIPKASRPCPPGQRRGGRDCQSSIDPRVSPQTAKRHYERWGDGYWVGTEHGRRAVAHAISKLKPGLRNDLKRKAQDLGFDVNYELKRTRPKARTNT
jgi:hypothetical protein